VIKCGVGGGALLTVLRTIWPDVPCIALIRNPLEIIVSNCKTPARWLHRWKENIETCWYGPPPESLDINDDVEFCGWVLGRFCAAVSAVAECIVIDYEHLTSQIISQLAAECRLSFSVEGRERLAMALIRDAKNSTRRFENDIETKRLQGTDAMKRSVDRWVAAEYETLRYRAVQQVAKLSIPSKVD